MDKITGWVSNLLDGLNKSLNTSSYQVSDSGGRAPTATPLTQVYANPNPMPHLQAAGNSYLKATAPLNNTLQTGFSNLMNSKYNPVAQFQAIRGMNPAQAQQYRGMVDQTPVNIPIPQQIQRIPIAGSIVNGVVNAIPHAGAGLATLAAPGTTGQHASDILKILGGLAQGLGIAHAASSGLSALGSQTPSATIVGESMNTPAINQAVVSSRPAHQALIEQALQRGDFGAVRNIINAIPSTDPYAQSMRSLFASIMGAH